MELSTPKQFHAQETKQKIYKAASTILKKKGYAYLTVSNICKVAGVSNGTFFYHFKTKDELLVYYNYQQFAEFRKKNQFDAAVEGKPFDERIRKTTRLIREDGIGGSRHTSGVTRIPAWQRLSSRAF